MENVEMDYFFSDAEHILDFCNYGTKIAEVELPEGEPVSDCGDKFKAHRIILKNIRNLWDVDVFKKLVEQGDDIHARNDLALREASVNDHLEIVKYLLEQGANVHANNMYFFLRVGNIPTLFSFILTISNNNMEE